MVLVANHVSIGRIQDDRADHPLGITLSRHVEDADSGKPLSLNGDKRVTEELVHAADHQHRGAISRQGPKGNGVVGKVVLDPRLTAVLAAPAEHEVRVARKVVAGVVLVDQGLVTVPTQPACQAAGVAEIAVDAHLARVDMNDLDLALAVRLAAHGSASSPKLARP